jgi:AcrR family transcriptional regulator
MPSAPRRTAQARDTYRHGDLRRALLDAAFEMAREGGPGMVALREATRRAGVTPNAAYRHFAGHAELMAAVRDCALAAAARAMEQALVQVPPLPPRAGVAQRQAHARAQVRAVGLGYLGFAWSEPGLFRTAFTLGPADALGTAGGKAGDTGRNPYELLGDALDGLMASGALPPERRPGAEAIAWSTVHGLALLVLEGPLGPLPMAQREALSARLLDFVERGL